MFEASNRNELEDAVAHCIEKIEPPYVVKIPPGSNQVRSYAFAGDRTLGVVILPDSVKLIGNEAFEGCEKLREANIPATVSEIREKAFQCCDLRSIHIPKSVVKICSEAFWGCNYLREIDVDTANPVYDYGRIAMPSSRPQPTDCFLAAATPSFPHPWSKFTITLSACANTCGK